MTRSTPAGCRSIGCVVKAVQALLGHSSPVTTAKIYISVLPELARRRAQATAHMLLTAARVKPDAGNSQA